MEAATNALANGHATICELLLSWGEHAAQVDCRSPVSIVWTAQCILYVVRSGDVCHSRSSICCPAPPVPPRPPQLLESPPTQVWKCVISTLHVKCTWAVSPVGPPSKGRPPHALPYLRPPS